MGRETGRQLLHQGALRKKGNCEDSCGRVIKFVTQGCLLCPGNLPVSRGKGQYLYIVILDGECGPGRVHLVQGCGCCRSLERSRWMRMCVSVFIPVSVNQRTHSPIICEACFPSALCNPLHSCKVGVQHDSADLVTFCTHVALVMTELGAGEQRIGP